MTTLEKTLRWVAIGGAYLLPFVCLIVATSLFFPYITGKNFAFRIIVEVMAGAWLALALVNPAYRPRRSWILGVFALFVFLIALSDALGLVPFKSFWSNYERMDGWVTLAHLLLYLVVAVSVLNTENLWRRLFQVSLVVSGFVAVYGFLQVAGDLALGQGGTSGLSARIDATFGNPIYLAVYMLFHVFLAATLWVQMWRERGVGRRLPLSLMYGFIIVLDTLALLFTGTRGTMLGLIGGTALALFIFALTPEASRRARTAIAVIYVVGALTLGGLWLARDTAFVHSVGFLDRLASISLSENTVNARFLNMGMAWQGVKERPILGWGQENYALVFDKYYDPRMYAQEPWFDRVHNIIFDWWVAGGTVGLLAYLAIFLAALWTLWRGPFSGAERAILTGLLAGYFMHNLTVFDNVTSYILFATLLGYLAWRASEARGAARLPEAKLMPAASLPFVAVAATLLLWGSAWWVNAGALAENRALIQAIQQHDGGLIVNLNYFKDAISHGSYGTQEAREQLAQLATKIAGSQGIDITTKQQFFDTATREMAAQAEASPLDARFPLFLGIVHGAYGDYGNAVKALQRAHELSPRKQNILFALAQNQAAAGDITGALATLKQAYEFETSYTEAALFYAAAAVNARQDTVADEVLAPLIPTGQAADPRVTAAYADRGRYDKIVTIWQAHVKAQPSDIQGYFTLAAAHYEAGSPANAIAVLRDVAVVAPAVKDQAEQLIQQIQDGTVQIGR